LVRAVRKLRGVVAVVGYELGLGLELGEGEEEMVHLLEGPLRPVQDEINTG